MIVLMVTASMFTNQKQRFWKYEVILANVSIQLKLWNTRSCIQFYFRNLGLHPKNIFFYPAPKSKYVDTKLVGKNGFGHTFQMLQVICYGI